MNPGNIKKADAILSLTQPDIPVLTHLFLMHHLSTPKNIKKSYGFRIFSGGRENRIGNKWVIILT